jgi:hypothetical protein
MDEIDWSRPDLRGGNRYPDRDSIFKQLIDVLDSGLYKKLPTQPSQRRVDKTYSDNETFWRGALDKQHFPSMRVRLQDFHLTEWVPSAPARYFTPNAQHSRQEAEHRYLFDRNEYNPDGKNLMILGGVGSFRLGVRDVNGKDYYFLGASSSGVSHEGIPIALNEHHYYQVIQMIKAFGGSKVTLAGTLRLIPIDLSPVQYSRDIPKYCLVLDEIEDAQPSSSQVLFTTVAITFQGDDKYDEWYWSFCTFQPDPLGTGLDKAVKWLKGYVKRYSMMENPPIMADFDEHYSHHFDNPVEFSLVDIANNRINMSRLQDFVRRFGGFNVVIKEVHSMDTYNVSGQAGAIGPNVHAHDMTFTQIKTQDGETIDLPKLAQQLSMLRAKMKEQAVDSEHDEAVGAVAAAETAAKKGDGSKAMEALAKAGKWALDVATQIGVGLAVEAIKSAMGVH